MAVAGKRIDTPFSTSKLNASRLRQTANSTNVHGPSKTRQRRTECGIHRYEGNCMTGGGGGSAGTACCGGRDRKRLVEGKGKG